MAKTSHRQAAAAVRNGRASHNGKTSERRLGRPIWRGLLRFSLVSIPVELYPSKVKGGGEIDLVWLHDKCHSRIHYKKVCPIHGEVDNDEIVSGYKYSQNKYVVIQPDELAKLRGQSDKALSIEAIIEPKVLDEIYLTDKSYYVIPDGPAAQKPYQVFCEAMRQQNGYGIAKVVLFKRDHIALLRPYDGLLLATTLSYAEHFKKPEAFKDEVPHGKSSPKELGLAKTLLDAVKVKDFDFSQYKDPYHDRVMQLVESKMKGEAIEVPEEEEEPTALNFMEALKKSLARTANHTEKANGSHRRQVRHRKVS